MTARLPKAGPSLAAINEFLASIPDAKLSHALRVWRGKERGD